MIWLLLLIIIIIIFVIYFINNKYSTPVSHYPKSYIGGNNIINNISNKNTDTISHAHTKIFMHPDDLIQMINDDYVSKSSFNIANKPNTTYYFKKNDKRASIYIEYVAECIQEWIESYNLDSNIKIISIRPIYVVETDTEFKLYTNVELIYHNKKLYLTLEYDGINDSEPDFFSDDDTDLFQLQLTNIKIISANEFKSDVKSAETYNGPFMTMSEQMSYVDYIDDMHQNEEII